MQRRTGNVLYTNEANALVKAYDTLHGLNNKVESVSQLLHRLATGEQLEDLVGKAVLEKNLTTTVEN